MPQAKTAEAWHEPLKPDLVSGQKWVHEGQARHREQRAQGDEAQGGKWGERRGEAQDERDEQWGEAQGEKWDEQQARRRTRSGTSSGAQQAEKQKWPADEKEQRLSWRWGEEHQAQRQKWPADGLKRDQQWLRSGRDREQQAQGSVHKAQYYACDAEASIWQARPPTLNAFEWQRRRQEQKRQRQQRGGRFKDWQHAKHAADRQGWLAQFLTEIPDPRRRI
ncbi:unnamed protein product [Prorocentrum cordatum]|uniref:Uncharacterized protein n=1 Tax=Prorocentrum cordatum TaxID=2364126 RepID=A0ABN9UGF3_9DINO|nr:unnamed protein product [Polarella glacialis]